MRFLAIHIWRNLGDEWATELLKGTPQGAMQADDTLVSLSRARPVISESKQFRESNFTVL